jgi:hypothetical protein
MLEVSIRSSIGLRAKSINREDLGSRGRQTESDLMRTLLDGEQRTSRAFEADMLGDRMPGQSMEQERLSLREICSQ